MMVHLFQIGQLRTNCYLVVCQKTKKAVVIDAGDEGSFLSEKILALGIKPKFVVATHGHFDHLLAAEELRLNFKIPFLLHQEDLFLLKKARQSVPYWLRTREEFLVPREVKFIKEGDKINFGKETFEVFETPGHTPGSVSLYNKKENILFCGDLLFQNGVGRTDFAYGSDKNLKNSLKKIFSLPPKTLVYPGHGEKFILKRQKND